MQKMWEAISDYAYEHQFCLHKCLPEVNKITQECGEDDPICRYNGIGIFCHAYIELACDIPEHHQSEYFKQIVKIIQHNHCVCNHAQDIENCPVHCWNTSNDEEDDDEGKSETGRDTNTPSAAKEDKSCVETNDNCWHEEFTKEDLQQCEGLEKEYYKKN